MATFYEDAAQTALALLTEFGASYSIRRLGNDYDPTTGDASAIAKVEGTIKALVLPVASTAKSVFTEADNRQTEALRTGKARFILAAAKGAPFEPEPNDLIELEGNRYTVLGCSPLSPAGVPLLYKIAAEASPAAASNATTLDLSGMENAVQALQDFVNS